MVQKKLQLILVIAVLLAGGAVINSQLSNAQTSTRPGVDGRYQIVFSPHARADAYLLDTQTGRAWNVVQYTDVVGTPCVWQYMDRLDTPEAVLSWIAGHKLIDSSERH